MNYYLAAGLAQPVPAKDGLNKPYFDGANDKRLVLQRCNGCSKFQWGPEWICHRCHAFELGWAQVKPEGVIYSYERVWHPVHPALREQGPYIVVLVELPEADGVRVVGNLLGDAQLPVVIGSSVRAVFEHHEDAPTPFALVQWQRG